jgi:hypothetical protein
MCVCMYVCMYRLYVCMYVCMYICMYACMHVCMNVCICVCMHECVYVCCWSGLETGLRLESPAAAPDISPCTVEGVHGNMVKLAMCGCHGKKRQSAIPWIRGIQRPHGRPEILETSGNFPHEGHRMINGVTTKGWDGPGGK